MISLYYCAINRQMPLVTFFGATSSGKCEKLLDSMRAWRVNTLGGGRFSRHCMVVQKICFMYNLCNIMSLDSFGEAGKVECEPAGVN